MSLLGFGMGTMLANFHVCGIMLVLRAVFNMLLRNASPRGPMCFRCMMFNLSGPCGCFCMSEVIFSFKSLRALRMLFLWVILHTMWSGKSLQLLCILPFGMLCLSAISMMFVKIMLVGMVVWPKADSVSSVNYVQSAFL